VRDLPALDTIRAEWRRVSTHVERLLGVAIRDQRAAPSTRRFPVDDPSVGAGLAFLLQHESYHIGQIALLRRQHGYPAMTYDRHQGTPP